MRGTVGQDAADVDGVPRMRAADNGAAERCGAVAMVMAANVALVAASDRSISGVAHAHDRLGATMALKDQWKSAPVNSVCWPYAHARRAERIRRRAISFFAIIRSRRTGPTA